MSSRLGQPNIRGSVAGRVLPKDEVHGESDIKVRCTVNLSQILGGQTNTQRLDIGLEMLDLALSDNREYIRRLVHHVRQCLSR